MKYKNFQDGFEIVTSYCKEKKLSRSLCNKIQIISEELIVNLLKHSKCEEYDFSCNKVDDEILLKLQYIAKEFDPTKELTHQHELDLEDRRLGGLGLHMVREFTTKFTYDYDRKRGLNVIEAYVKV